MKQSVTLRITLVQPPPGVDFGVQLGRGHAYQTIDRQRSKPGADLVFDVTIDRKPGPAVDFSGPLVHGKPGERFLYIDIGTSAGQHDSCWTRRLKVPLYSITATMLASGSVLETRIPGTARDGGPICATPKPLPAWSIARA